MTHLAGSFCVRKLKSSHLLLQIAEGDNGKSASLETLCLVPLVERQQCDGCASCITDVHRTCKECGYDVCIRCCRGLREQGQVSGSLKTSPALMTEALSACYPSSASVCHLGSSPCFVVQLCSMALVHNIVCSVAARPLFLTHCRLQSFHSWKSL